MDIAVTGGAGGLGEAVCGELTEAGHHVRILDRVWRRDLPQRVTLVSLLDGPSLYPLLDGADAVVHLGNHAGPERHIPPQQIYAENMTMNANVFQAAVDLGISHIVFASSVHAFSGRRRGEEDLAKPSSIAYLPVDGNLPARPGNTYGLSKVAGEQLLQYYAGSEPGLSAVALRLPWLIRPKHQHWFAQRRERSQWHLRQLDELFAFLMMPDAARLVRAALEKAGPGYHQYFAAAKGNLLGATVQELIEVFYPDVPQRGDVNEETGLSDLTILKAELDWEPTCHDLYATADA